MLGLAVRCYSLCVPGWEAVSGQWHPIWAFLVRSGIRKGFVLGLAAGLCIYLTWRPGGRRPFQAQVQPAPALAAGSWHSKLETTAKARVGTGAVKAASLCSVLTWSTCLSKSLAFFDFSVVPSSPLSSLVILYCFLGLAGGSGLSSSPFRCRTYGRTSLGKSQCVHRKPSSCSSQLGFL